MRSDCSLFLYTVLQQTTVLKPNKKTSRNHSSLLVRNPTSNCTIRTQRELAEADHSILSQWGSPRYALSGSAPPFGHRTGDSRLLSIYFNSTGGGLFDLIGLLYFSEASSLLLLLFVGRLLCVLPRPSSLSELGFHVGAVLHTGHTVFLLSFHICNSKHRNQTPLKSLLKWMKY